MGIREVGAATDDLFVGALAEIKRDDDGPVPCLVALHSRPTRQVFEQAASLLACEDPVQRELGAHVLRELGPYDEEGRRPFTRETIDVVLAEMQSEPDPWVLGCMISVLGYHNARETLDLVLAHQSHAAQPVRFAVAAALPCLADPSHTQDRVVETLLRLSEDDNDAVSWYALYALFQETAGVAGEQLCAWARGLVERGDSGRRAQLHHLGATLDDTAPVGLRETLGQARGT